MSDGGFLNQEQASQPEVVETPAAPTPVEVSTSEVVPVVASEAVQEQPIVATESTTVETDEQVYELPPENPDTFLETPNQVLEQAGASTVHAATTDDPTVATPVTKDEVTLQVEKILEEGLGNYYNHMPEQAKARFHAKGEEVTVQIANMVRSLHVKVKSVLQLIAAWLRTIPGVNKFFLEQESKIKTDRILELQEVRKQELQAVPA